MSKTASGLSKILPDYMEKPTGIITVQNDASGEWFGYFYQADVGRQFPYRTLQVTSALTAITKSDGA